MRLDASPDEVFCFVTTVDRLPEWNAAITRVVEPLRELAPGREWVVEMRAMGNSWRSRSRVLHHESTSRLFSYRSCTDDGNPSYGDWTWRVTPDAEGAHVAVSWELHPRTFWRRVLMARIRNRQLRAEVRASLQAAEACLTPARERR
jgi:uncharacterized protein YndB with AHSA1/START domain